MRVEVFQQEKAEKVIRLKLEENGKNAVSLVAVDERGERVACGHLATITAAGIELSSSVNEDIGISLDSRYKIRVL